MIYQDDIDNIADQVKMFRHSRGKGGETVTAKDKRIAKKYLLELARKPDLNLYQWLTDRSKFR